MPWALALVLTLLGGTLWRQHARQAQERAERKAAWTEYLHGPLSDLLYGSTRLRPLLLKKKLSKAEEAEAIEAAHAFERSRVLVPRIRAELTGDPSMGAMDMVVTWHQEIGALMEPWRGLRGRGLGKDAVSAEAALRLKLWQVLDGLRDQVLADKSLSSDEVLEMNALLYSLKEETEPPAKAGH